MKDKFSMAIFDVLLVFGLFLAGCSSLNNLFNPIHAINTNGEMIAAVLGSGQTVKIDEVEYQYMDRPIVPIAPEKPNPPQKPTPPSKPNEPSGTVTYHAAGKSNTVSWSNGEELRQILRLSLDTFSRNNLQSQYDQWLQEQQKYNANLSAYQDKIAKYQQDYAKYRQDVAKYEKENAEYQANLPRYQAMVEAEIKSIQDSINPNAPNNWDRYVEGQFLLYKGKYKGK